MKKITIALLIAVALLICASVRFSLLQASADPFPTTQNVSGSVSVTSLPALPAGTNNVGSVNDRINSAGEAQAPLCDSSVVISDSASGETQLVALASGKNIYICSFSFQASGNVNVNFAYGTGTACATGTTALTGAYPEASNTGVSMNGGDSPVFSVPSGSALCLNLSAAVGVYGVLSYAQH